ncbi:MAG: hypothetical protein DSZ26_01125 [Thermovibrio sp.]|nr:MAG: hypothetical protein DSZ26_01125 [Thermovibrio sp.]
MRKEVNINHLTRVEGHGAVSIVFENDRLKEIKLRFTEGPRFFEYITKERLFIEVPKIVSRICGICYVSHRLASCFAIEDAFKAGIPDEIKLLRELLTVGEFLESHALHLYFLALPDFMGYGSTLEMANDYPNVVKRGFFIKDVGNRIMKIIGGKTVHGENIVPGGFESIPKKEELEEIRELLYRVIPEVEATISLFDSFNYEKTNKEHSLGLCIDSEKFSLIGDKLFLSDGTIFTKREYEIFVEEKVSDYSTAKYSTINGKPYLIGPLSRVNHYIEKLSGEVKKRIQTLKNRFPTDNTLLANLSRAIEMLELSYRGLDIVEDLLKSYPFTGKVKLHPRKGTGYGVKEAPRGTLYHRYTFNEEGRCIGANIITPTAQLQSVVEKDLKELVELHPELNDSELKKKAEILVRAYDP